MATAALTTTEFAAELGTDTRTVRKFLRAITPRDEQPGKGSRWALPGTKRELTKMKKQFAEWTAATEARKAEKAEKAAEKADEDAAEVDLDDEEPTDEELMLEEDDLDETAFEGSEY